MGLFSRILYGVDPEEDQRTMDATDAALRREIEADRQAGNISDQVAAQSQTNVNESVISNAQGQVNEAFLEGLEEGVSNIVGVPGRLIGGIPLSIWLIGGVALFVWMGGMGMLKGKLLK